MEANCGPSNALNSLAKHTQQDRSLQNEFNRNYPNQSQQNFKSNQIIDNRLNQDFENFNGQNEFANNFINQFNSKPRFQSPHTNQQPGWVQDFSNLAINQRPSEFEREQQPVVSSNWHRQFLQQNQQAQRPQVQNRHKQQFTPNYASGFNMNMRTNLSTPLYQQELNTNSKLTEHQELHELEKENEMFKDQFDMIEQEMDQETIEEVDIQVDDNDREKEEFAKTAKKVHDSMLNSHASAETNDKFQKSNFLKLMSSISNRSVELEGNKLVDKANGEEIKNYLSDPLKNIKEEVNYHDPVHESSNENNQGTGNRRPIRSVYNDPPIHHLPDPLSHIRDGSLSNINSPLQAAQIISGNQVKAKDWVDDDSWLDMSQDTRYKPNRNILSDEWQEVYDDYRHDDD